VNSLLLALLLQLPGLLAPAPADKARDAALAAALERCFPGAFNLRQDPPPQGDRTLWSDALASEAFVRGAVGPFDVLVYVADGIATVPEAQHVLDKAQAGLRPLAKLYERRFDRPQGLVSGRRWPIVLCSSKPGQPGFDQLLALLDWCEQDFSGWTKDNGSLFTQAEREAPMARTWEVLLINLANPEVVKQGDAFLEHGLGYDTLAHLVNILLRRGSWGACPPWLDQGLIDELDIEAYGEAWVGGDWFEWHQDGWFREGWSGFLPTGMSPPPPVTGPPADLATKVRLTGDSWAHRAYSGHRHWDQLRGDIDLDYPPSLRFMHEHESFLPRDRAYARCVWNLVLELAPPATPDVLARLDRQPTQLPGGMFDCDPITTTLSGALGGIPLVDELAQMPLKDKLDVLKHKEILRELEDLGAAEMVGIADYRQAGEWLVSHPEFDDTARRRIFDLILTAEHYEQQADFGAICGALDHAAQAAIKTSPHYPTAAKDKSAVAKAFLKGLAQ
jgi:hypothetical protein